MRQVVFLLRDNLRNPCVEDFVFLKSDDAGESGPDEIFSQCLSDSVIFEKFWAKISLSFNSRRGPFPVNRLMTMMQEFPDAYVEIETISDCNGLVGVLARNGQNLAVRELGLANLELAGLTSLFLEHQSTRILMSG